MDHAFWSGYLKLSLVTCPVAMAPAVTESEKVRFRTLNRATGNAVVSRYVDAETGKVVNDDRLVKGYARGEGDYVLLEDEEIASVALESARTIDIEMFVGADSVDWIWYDKPHFLTPRDSVGEEAFTVIRDAMKSTGTVGISRLALYRRERAVLLEPRDKGIVLWTLRFGDEVRDGADVFPDGAPGSEDADLKALVAKLIDSRRGAWTPEMVDDPVQARLEESIATKQQEKSRRPKRRPQPKATARNVVSITDALRNSIASDKDRKRR